MFSLQPDRARMCVAPYKNRKRPHLKWTITGYYVGGKRVRRFFSTKEEAGTFVKQLQTKAANLGLRATHIDQRFHVMALECHDQLEAHGKTIADATAFYKQHLESVERSCTVKTVVSRFLRDKESDGKSARYLRDLHTRLHRFQLDFDNRIIATISPLECNDWLRELGLSPRSRNNYRRVLHTLFGYASALNLCSENPMVKTAKAKVIDLPVQVFTPVQIQRLLESSDLDALPCLAIAAFAGLRPIEIARLDWQEIKLERRFIEVAAEKSKTARRRLVSIQENLAAWLQLTPRKQGPIEPSNFRKKVDAARARARIETWPPNVLRHSYASYHLAKFQDAPALALQMGHTTTAMLFAHYREVVTPQDAERYWAIVPERDG